MIPCSDTSCIRTRSWFSTANLAKSGPHNCGVACATSTGLSTHRRSLKRVLRFSSLKCTFLKRDSAVFSQNILSCALASTNVKLVTSWKKHAKSPCSLERKTTVYRTRCSLSQSQPAMVPEPIFLDHRWTEIRVACLQRLVQELRGRKARRIISWSEDCLSRAKCHGQGPDLTVTSAVILVASDHPSMHPYIGTNIVDLEQLTE